MKKLLCSTVFVTLISNILFAQSLVNLSSTDTLSQRVNYQLTETATTDGSNNYMMFNLYQTGQSTDYAIVKLDSNNNQLWTTLFNSPGNKSDFGVADYYKNNYLYATGFSYDSATSTSEFNTLKLDAATGDTIWSKSYHGSYAGYEAPSQVIADDAGSVYVTGAVETATGSAMVLIKYDSLGNQLWASTWDSIGLFNGGVSMAISPGSNIAVTGFSGGAFESFSFGTWWFSFNGILLSTALSANGSGTFSRPVAIQHDQFNGTMIIGSAATYGGNSQIKIVCYDTDFVLQHVITWGDSSQVTTASGMANDNAGNMLVSGTTTNASGGKNAVVINFQGYPPLTYSWVKQISAPDPTKEASAAAVTFDKNDNPLITGRVYNGSSFDLLTAEWDINGNPQWTKNYYGGTGRNNAGTAILVNDANNIMVGASSVHGADTSFMSLLYNQWSPGSCYQQSVQAPVGLRSDCPTITYNFRNGQFTTAGADTFVEFDIYGLQNTPELPLSAANLYFTYSNAAFGGRVVDSSNITVTRGAIISDSNYVISLADTLMPCDAVPSNGGEVLLSFASNHPNSMFQIADTFQQLCHVKMKMKKTAPVAINFDQFFMQNLSAYHNDFINSTEYTEVYTGDPLAFDKTFRDDPYGISYRLLFSTSTASSISFYVEAEMTNADNGAIAPFNYGTVALTYNASAFGENIVANGKVSVQAVGDVATLAGGGNSMYSIAYKDNSPTVNELYISIQPTTDYDESTAPTISTSAFDEMLLVTLTVSDCSEDGQIGLKADDMSGANAYFDQGSSNVIAYAPVDAADAPAELTGNVCNECSHSITGIATSQDATSRTSVSIPSGTQDELFIIYGCGFGTQIGTVYFQNADHNSLVPFSQTDLVDFQLWSDDEIDLYITSETGDLSAPGNDGPGSGSFYVKTVDNIQIYPPSGFTLEIPFAVSNSRSYTSGKPTVAYLIQQSEIGNNGCYGCCTTGLADDPCHTNGYVFTLQDPNTATETSAFPGASFTDVKNSVFWALEEWVCNTGVNFTFGTQLDEFNIGMQLYDYQNMICSMAPGNNWLPYGAAAATSRGWGNACPISTPIQNTTYTHDYFLAPILDIDIAFDNTTTAAPPPPGHGTATNYDYVLNDPNIAANQKLFSRDVFHEFGHASGLDHVLPSGNEIMYYGFPYGAGGIINAPNANDIAGGVYVLNPIGLLRASTNCQVNDANHGSAQYCTTLGINSQPLNNIWVNEYPDPFSDELDLNFDLTENSHLFFSLYSILGQVVYQEDLGNFQSGKYSKSFTGLDKIASGMYLVKLKINEQEEMLKLIKQ